MSEKLDSTGTALVNDEHFYKPITDETPRGVTMILCNIQARRARVGVLSPKDNYWTHYAGAPIFKD